MMCQNWYQERYNISKLVSIENLRLEAEIDNDSRLTAKVLPSIDALWLGLVN